MGVGVMKADPVTAMKAVIRIEKVEIVDSKFTDQKGRAQKQFATELKVLSGAGERNGEVFTDWFSFPAHGDIPSQTRTGQVLTGALGEDARAETLEELAGKLVGKTFVAQIGTSKDGRYSRVVHDTISAAPTAATEDDGESDLEDNFDDLPF